MVEEYNVYVPKCTTCKRKMELKAVHEDYAYYQCRRCKEVTMIDTTEEIEEEEDEE